MEKLKNPKKEDKLKESVAVILSISFFIILSFFVDASPLLPDTFSGNVAIDDKSAPIGTKIEVYISKELKLNHTIAEEGAYTLAVKQGSLNDRIEFKISGLIAGESVRKGVTLTKLDLNAYTDKDKDGINDAADSLLGDGSSINNNYGSLRISINNSETIPPVLSGTQKIVIYNNDKTVLEFDFDFDSSALNLFNLEIKKDTEDVGSVLIKGIEKAERTTKTAYMEKTNATLNSVCVKDEDIDSIANITSDCSGANETKVACDSIDTGGYTCTLTGNIYKIAGLKNSGIKQISYSRPSSGGDSGGSSSGGGSSGGGSSGGGSGGGGGGGSAFFVCNMDWKCGSWLSCENGKQTRECSLVKVAQHAQDSPCPDSSKSPETARACESPKNDLSSESPKIQTKAEQEEKNKEAPASVKSEETKKQSGGLGGITGAVTGQNIIDRLLANPKAMKEIKMVALVFVAASVGIFLYLYRGKLFRKNKK